MTTKEYVKKYELDKNDKFNHSEFVIDLSNDFISLLEVNKAPNNIKGFENALRAIRMKFDAINNKTVGVIEEKLWKYFFATVVVKLREKLCPKEMEQRREQKELKQKEWEQRKKMENDVFHSFFDSGFRNFYNMLLGIKYNQTPIESFNVLCIPHDSTIETVKSQYKKLALIHHPDKGGKQEDFILITDAKNKCLSWLEQIEQK